MKRIPLFHPRVFDHPQFADIYFKKNAVFINRTAKSYVRLLKSEGFESGRVLDAGCGFGAVAVEIARSFPHAHITGIDLSGPLLKLGNEIARKAGVEGRVTFSSGDVQHMDFEDDTFDLTVNSFLLHIVDDPVCMLNELERTTTKEGMIILSDLRRSWLGLFKKKLRTALTMEEGKKIIRDADIRNGEYRKGLIRWDFKTGCVNT